MKRGGGNGEEGKKRDSRLLKLNVPRFYPLPRTNPIFKDEILALIRDPNTRNRYRSGSRYLERFLSRKVSNAGQVCQTQSFEIFGYRWKTLPLSIPSTKVDWKGDRVETVHLEKKKVAKCNGVFRSFLHRRTKLFPRNLVTSIESSRIENCNFKISQCKSWYNERYWR